MTSVESSAVATGIALGIGGLAKSWRAFPDRLIPTLVAAVGALVAPALAGWSSENVIHGLTAGLAATGANQLYRHTVPTRTGDTERIKKP